MKKLLLFVPLVLVLTLGYVTPVLANHSVRVVNAGTHVIVRLQISDVNEQQWGTNLLRRPLHPGRYRTLRISPCYEDIRLRYGDGHLEWQNSVNTCTGNATSSY